MRTGSAPIALAAMWSVCLAGCSPAAARDDRSAALTFEGCGGGLSSLWHSPHTTTAFVDSTEVHGGKYAVRIERVQGSPLDFTPISIQIPRDFDGKTVGLRGWARSLDVTGWGGLWLRQDGPSGVVGFDNMHDRPIRGTTAWQRYEITLPLEPATRTLIVGALLVGEGTLWVDDIEVLVDGKPLAQAPPFVAIRTVLETDTEFDRGSGIRDSVFTDVQVENLALLCKVWGFLKYHDRRVTGGERHFDYDLFRVMPRILAAGDRKAAHRALDAWVASLGSVHSCSPCARPTAEAAIEPELDWLQDEAMLGPGLSSRLRAIHANRSAEGDHFYVGFHPGVGNPDFSNEAAYRPAKDLPDPGFRLLALFRFWNMVEYWFPYRDVMEEDWDRVLRESIAPVAAAESKTAYALALARVVARIHDGHANVYLAMKDYPPSGESSVPVITRFVEGQEVVTAYANPSLGPASGLRIGDVIEAIDGVPVDSIVSRSRPWYGVSNEVSYRNLLSSYLTRGKGDADLLVRRGDRVLALGARRVREDSLNRRVWNDHPGPAFRRLSDDLAYLTLSSVDAGSVNEYLRGLSGAKALIIDIRNYPSSFVVFALGQHLVEQPTPFVCFTRADPANPGSFVWTPPVNITPKSPRIVARVAVLVDEKSQSSAEYTAMAFRVVPEAIVVGSQTAGADGNLSMLALPGFLKTGFSGIGVFYPDKRPTQRVGIVPDIEVRPTIAGIRAGRDEVLEAAVEALLNRPITRKEYETLKAQ